MLQGSKTRKKVGRFLNRNQVSLTTNAKMIMMGHVHWRDRVSQLTYRSSHNPVSDYVITKIMIEKLRIICAPSLVWGEEGNATVLEYKWLYPW